MFQDQFFGSNDIRNRKNVVTTKADILFCNIYSVALWRKQEASSSDKLKTACIYNLYVIRIGEKAMSNGQKKSVVYLLASQSVEKLEHLPDRMKWWIYQEEA